MTAWLTLATGEKRWEDQGGGFNRYRYKEEGALWVMVMTGERSAPLQPNLFVILKPHVAEWCFENIRAYRIVQHAPHGRYGPDEEDSWRIEFKNDGDMLLFNATWGEQL